jgi:hypothetical protein
MGAPQRYEPPSPAWQALSAAVSSACGIEESQRAPRAIDWSEFLRLADRHQVAPLINSSGWLASAGAPAETRAAILDRARRNATTSLRLLDLQRQVLEVLQDAAVPALVLKGAVTAAVYDSPSARQAGDLDVLVSPAAADRAVEALQAAGFDWIGFSEPPDPDRPPVSRSALANVGGRPLLYEASLGRDGLQVEVHWRLFPNERLLPLDPAWFQSPRLVQVQSLRVPTLRQDTEWLYLNVHGSSHRWSRMKWVADVALYARRHGELVEAGRLSDAGSRGHSASLATGLLIAEAALGPFLPADARAWASRSRGAAMLARRSWATLVADDYPNGPTLPGRLLDHMVARLSLRRDARYRSRELRLMLLAGARAQSIDDPGWRDLLRGPGSWARRAAKRRRAGHR